MRKIYSKNIVRFICWYGVISIVCLVCFVCFVRPSPRSWFLRGLLFGNTVTSTVIIAVAKEFEVKTDRVRKEEERA